MVYMMLRMVVMMMMMIFPNLSWHFDIFRWIWASAPTAVKRANRGSFLRWLRQRSWCGVLVIGVAQGVARREICGQGAGVEGSPRVGFICPPTSVATLGVLTVGVDSRWSHTCAPFLITLLTTAQKLLHLPFWRKSRTKRWLGDLSRNPALWASRCGGSVLILRSLAQLSWARCEFWDPSRNALGTLSLSLWRFGVHFDSQGDLVQKPWQRGVL